MTQKGLFCLLRGQRIITPMYVEFKTGRGRDLSIACFFTSFTYTEKGNRSRVMKTLKHMHFFKGKMNYTAFKRNKMIIS